MLVVRLHFSRQVLHATSAGLRFVIRGGRFVNTGGAVKPLGTDLRFFFHNLDVAVNGF